MLFHFLVAGPAKAVIPKVPTIPIEIVPVEPKVTPVMLGFKEVAFATIADKIPAVMADICAVLADIAAVGARCLGLGSNSGKEKTDGE